MTPRLLALSLTLLAAPLSADEVRRLPADAGAAVLYVALGDSTVFGVGATGPERNYVSRLYERLRAVYAGARLVNLGVGGATAADVVDGQLPRAVGLHPDLVTLSIGPNDITRRRDVQEYEHDLATIFQALRRETSAVVVVNLIPDLAVTPRFKGRKEATTVGRRVVQFNRALALQARTYGVEVVDLYTASRREVPRRPELIGADAYHPSDWGYARWAELMWQGVHARLSR